MKRMLLDEIQGNEIIGKDIYTSNGNLIMSEGTVLKKEYIHRLLDLGIKYVFIKTEKELKHSDSLTESKIQEDCCNIVRNTIERYSYCGNVELEQIKLIAEKIMKDVMEEKEVLYNVSMIRDRSQSLYGHSVNVAALSIMVALHMKMKADRVKEIAIGSLLHDIGFAYLASDYWNLSMENCSENSLREIKKHVINGFSAISSESWVSNISKDIILYHHERCDGTGYPFGLVEEKISKECKIVSLCDEFDSLIYAFFRKPKKLKDCFDYLMSEAGRKFDLKTVNSFLAVVAAYPIGAKVILNTGEVGVVIRQNAKMPTRPIIRLLVDDQGKLYLEEKIIDLLEKLTLFIYETDDI